MRIGVYTTVLLCATMVATGEDGPVRFVGDFESGDLSPWRQERCCDYSITVVEEPVRAGKYAARFEVRRDQPDVANSKRAELKVQGVPPCCERWYGFSVYIPEDFELDPTPEIVAQWHGVPDFGEGETWRSPPLALLSENGKWKVDLRWDSRRVMPKNVPEGQEVLDLGPYEHGRWTDWVFRCKWSWEEDGLLEVWKDGKQVYRREGPNAYNDANGTYFKTGIYKWMYKKAPEKSSTEQRAIYIDEVRIGDEAAVYNDVAVEPWVDK